LVQKIHCILPLATSRVSPEPEWFPGSVTDDTIHELFLIMNTLLRALTLWYEAFLEKL